MKIPDITQESDLGHFFNQLNKRLKPGEKFHGKINLKKHKASKTEFIGTAIHSGFDFIKEKFKNPQFHFSLKKINKASPLDEIIKARKRIFKQQRIGKQGQLITIHKLRTMYPMAHKAHEYMLKKAKTGMYGKPKDDFRITPLGKSLRRYWIDELFQLINIIKGEMKLVGLRPLTREFYKSLPPSLQAERIKHLPGLMAAIYADRPKNLQERITSEVNYIKAYNQNPLLTDVKYFFKILWSILIRGQRGH